MNEKKSGEGKKIVGAIVLIIVLFVGIKLIFYGLDQMIPKQTVDVSRSVSQDVSSGGSGSQAEAPGFCVHCGKALPDSFQWGQFCPWCGEKIEE